MTMYDSFISFLVGIAVGLVLGIVVSSILAAIRQNADMRNENE